MTIRWPVLPGIPILPQTKEVGSSEKEKERVASDSTVEIADADRATYYLRYRDDLCLPTARFSNFVGVPSCLFRDAR